MGLNRSDKYSSNHQLNSDGRQRDDKVKAKLEIVKVDVDNNMVCIQVSVTLRRYSCFVE